MSDLELERSATAPHRWVELCNVSKKQHPNDFSSLPLRAGRNIDLNALTATLNLKAHIFIILNFTSCQVDDTWWPLRLKFFLF